MAGILIVASIASPDESCLAERGRFPVGAVGAITIDSHLLLYGSGSALAIDDVSDPRFPRREGFLDLGTQTLDVEARGQVTYAATEEGLHIIDIRRPAAPRQVGFVTTPHPARSVEVHEKWAFVAGGNGLSLINVRDHNSPWRVWSRISPSCDYDDLELKFPLLFAIGCGLKIIDVSNPLFETALARLEVNGSTVAVEGNTVTVTDHDRLQLIDVSDPSNPVAHGSLWTHGVAKDAVLTNGVAVASSDGGLTVFDITSLDSPEELAHLSFPGGTTSLAAAPGLVYAANGGFLWVVSLDDPATPTGIGHTGNSSSARVAVSGQFAVTTHGFYGPGEDTVTVIDVGQPRPIEAGVWKAIWGPEDVDIVDSVAFVTADGGLYALDLSDPAQPVELSFLDLIESQYLAVDSGYAYIATMGVAGFPSFQVVDVSDPTNMYEVGNYGWGRGGPYPTAVDSDGDTAVVADNRGLRIFDVSDPRNPTQVGRWEQLGASGVALEGNLVVVGFSSPTDPDDTGISVIEISSPENLVTVGSWSAPSAVVAISIFGSAVLVGSEFDGVFMINLEDPARPTEVGHWTLGRLGVVDLAAAWPTAVVTNGDFGVTVLSLDRSCVQPRRPSRRVDPSDRKIGYSEPSFRSSAPPS